MAAQQHIVSFSTGLSSALTVERVLARYGRHNTEIVFMNTYIEDEDNHRFMNDCATRWGIDIITLADGRTPYQVAEDEQIIPNQKVAPCTFKLKIELFRAYLQSKDNSPLTVHIGYDYTEVHRCKTTRDAYRKYGWHIDFPLLWKPYELRNYADVVRQDWGVEPPRTYGLGFTHANCLQWGCVKMGQADWMRLLLNFPDRYARTEAWEQRMRKHPKRQNYAIMRDQSNGTVTPLPLSDFRQRYESQLVTQPLLFNLEARQSSCIYCGVGDLGIDTAQEKRYNEHTT